MRARTLGGLSLEGATFRQSKPLLLLSFLALESAQERRYLATLFWPTAKDPLGSLRSCIRQLRQVVGDRIRVESSTVATSVTTDAAAFERAFEEGDTATTMALYGGPFMQGLVLDEGNAELEEWVVSRRERYAGLQRLSLLRRAEVALEQGRIMRATAYADAAYRVRATAEFDVITLNRLYAVVLACHSPLLSELRLLANGLGMDLPGPDTVSQRGRRASDVVARLNPRRPPVRVESSAMRGGDVQRLVDLLSESTYPVVSVWGPPRTGKSLLALEAFGDADVLSAYDRIVAYLDVSRVRDGRQLPAEVAHAFGLQGEVVRNVPSLGAFLGHQRALLFLDDIDSERSWVVPLVQQLVDSCPNLKIMTTTRAPLGFPSETLLTMERWDWSGPR